MMLLIFYGLQIAPNTVTEAMGVGQIDIDPMVAGIITRFYLRCIILPKRFVARLWQAPKGHIEAATALVLLVGAFRRIMFPAMMRYARQALATTGR